MGRLLGVSASGFHVRVKRPPSGRALPDIGLLPKIYAIIMR